MRLVELASRQRTALSRLLPRSRLPNIRAFSSEISTNNSQPESLSFEQRTYKKLAENYQTVLRVLGEQGKHLTYTERILYSHLDNVEESLLTNTNGGRDIRGNANLKLKPDRVAMQDASAQMALLQFMTCNLPTTAIPASIHCDHLIVGENGAEKDLDSGLNANKEVFDFLESAAKKYGIDFWRPGAGIIHQNVLENYAMPGLMMLGTDSHTPNAGGLGAIAIGVGGADAVEALVGAPWELKAPRILGVHLKGRLRDWTTPKDVILHLAGKLTVRGGTGFIIEYYGHDFAGISCTGMATICNMGAEVGATTSIFPLSLKKHYSYLTVMGRRHIVDLIQTEFVSNRETSVLHKGKPSQYDEVITIDLNELEPHINGPFTPDLSTPLSQFKKTVEEQKWPEKLSAGLIGSCTNSSYSDMIRASSLVKQATEAGLKPASDFYITPGSDKVLQTITRDGVLDVFEKAGGIVLSNACGPCIGQWKRADGVERGESNAIFTSYNRNFRGRNDGNLETMNFLASPDLVTAMAFAGKTTFDPRTDSITTPDGKEFRFSPPSGFTREPGEKKSPWRFASPREEFEPVISSPDASVPILIAPDSSRLALLEPFDPFPDSELSGLRVLVKVAGKCTTDTISAAGPWLKYKGHLPNISENTLNTATNAETDEVNVAYDFDGSKHTIPELGKRWKAAKQPWLVVAEHNYGEGSAREHAALQPRYLGARVVLTKSFARIHETNLKKQGVVPLTFADEADYDRIGACDEVATEGLLDMLRNGGEGEVRLRVKSHKTGEEVVIPTKHAISRDQAEFILAGSALNLLSQAKPVTA